ncbi:formate/nitrite transporter family protein [Sporomusa sp.]|uniref:formate/nitrite transporter family protein n=1 Tax=Sporomusa sp. TaxID=2078658 RepID=UPI002C36404D|nr:formate/nitrite transporter family protein [Sporomusa sp.]HWR41784.1 formate/nitrite transporter family protein [Sporomusa sp.]
MNCFTPTEVAENCCKAQVNRTKLSIGQMIVLGLIAGFYIAFGANGATMATHDFTSLGAGFQRFAFGSVFSVGLMMVINNGAELFTGNSLMWTALIDGRISIYDMFRNWFWVLLANLVGSVAFAVLMYYTGLWKFNNALFGAFALKIAVAKVNLTWTEAFVRAIFCNWLVCIAVWMSLAAKDVISKCAAAYVGVMTFVMSNFEHSIANMYFLPAGLFAKYTPGVIEAAKLPQAALDSVNWASIILNNWIPVTLGNIVGGTVFVASLYWYSYVRKPKIQNSAVAEAAAMSK